MRYDKNAWEKVTIIKDTVHGYISIPKPIMREIIDTKTFQRLKNVEQTGMEALYPSATHNRFTHSIGVYHLAKRAFSEFRKNVLHDFPDIYQCIQNKYTDTADEVWDRWQLLFHLACLLHDCGHSPFSHTLEFIYDLPYQPEEHTLNNQLLEGMGERFSEDVIMSKSNMDSAGNFKLMGAPHERMSALYIKKKGNGHFREAIETLLKAYEQAFLVHGSKAGYYSEDINTKQDIEFMIRMIIGCRYNVGESDCYLAERGQYQEKNNKNWLLELQLRNCIITMLNSKLDVDNLDYVVRDSKYSGYANHTIDLERLLSSFTIVTGYDFSELSITADDNLDYCINLHKFNGTKIDARISGACHMKSEEDNIFAYGNIVLESNKSDSELRQRSFRTDTKFSAHIKFDGQNMLGEAGKISIAPLDGEYCYLNVRGTMVGMFSGVILTNKAEQDIPNWRDKGRKRIYFAYYQNSMSVLMSAIDGSNFEKKWIYAHQTSTFTNDYLNIYLLEKYTQWLTHREIKRFHEDLDNLQREVIQTAFIEDETDVCTDKNEIVKLEEELASNNMDGWLTMLETRAGGPTGGLLALLKGVLDLCTTCKKVEDAKEFPDSDVKSNQEFWNAQIDKACRESKRFPDDIFEKIQEFNRHYGRLRAKEYQYFLDVVAMHADKVIMSRYFSKSSDEDLMAAYKQAYLSCLSESEEIRNGYREFIDNYEYLTFRKYMKCLWKSYPEYLFYFQDWTQKDLDSLAEFLAPKSVPMGFQYLVMSDYVGEMRINKPQREFWEYLRERFDLVRFVCVRQTIKTKQFMQYETYMKFGIRVLRLEDIGLYSRGVGHDTQFYYFYYEQKADSDKEIDATAIVQWLGNRIRVNKKKTELRNRMEYVAEDIVIRDNIHGDIKIPGKFRMLVDCREFQRLRRIKQLATAGQIYPGAIQTRFSHSIGAFYVMNKILEHFDTYFNKIGKQGYIDDEEKEAVLAAALLHDIGHGPFSHAFEAAGITPKSENHETWTERIISDESTEINRALAQWGADFPQKVLRYIRCRDKIKSEGKTYEGHLANKLNLEFIFSSLVSGQLDADRMDYLLRDSKSCGVTYGDFDLEKLIESLKVSVTNDGLVICGDARYLMVLEEYFYARFQMYYNVYLHPYKVMTEKLLQKILRMASDLYIQGNLKEEHIPPLFQEIFKHAEISLNEFCHLDDFVVMGAIQTWSVLRGNENKELALLCRFFLDRRGFSMLELSDADQFMDRLKEKFGTDFFEGNVFIECNRNVEMYDMDQFDPVYILMENGTLSEVNRLTGIVNRKKNEKYLFFSETMADFHMSKEQVKWIHKTIKEFAIRNTIEIEKKYVFEEMKLNEIQASIISKLEELAYEVKMPILLEQVDNYYDTDDFLLKKNLYSVRTRAKDGTRYCFTCKYPVNSNSDGVEGQLERNEYEREIETDEWEAISNQVPNNLLGFLEDNGKDIHNLKKKIIIKNSRQLYTIVKKLLNGHKEKYEMVFDRVRYINCGNGKEASEAQLEIELKSSYEMRISMKEMTDELEKMVPELQRISDSKYVRALNMTK